MNVAFFLTPKREVEYIYSEYTVRQTLEKMSYHKYASIPIIDRYGFYCGTITEGDLLWFIKGMGGMSLKDAEEVPIMDIPRKMDYLPVHIDSDIDDLIDKALNQNFVPVIDDSDHFIGIVTRKDIILNYCKKIV
ncbi:MAG TPA: CBS domain-containing protein [Candidatus Scybalocola faecipullorum]|nr:CBS domain-containing protein [Candidatus Scybalocola faecipullorum]